MAQGDERVGDEGRRRQQEELERARQGNPLTDYWRAQFSGDPYAGSQGFDELLGLFESNPAHYLQSEANIDTWVPVLKGYGTTFQQMFRNMVGRDPNADEYSNFFQSVVIPDWVHPIAGEKLRESTTGLLNQFYSRLAEDEAIKRAEDEATQALAPGSAFDQWQQSYRQGLSDTEQALADYQTKLFEKLRPNLMTSLQSQGLLNTGALNTALAGASKDLSEESQRFLLGARSAAEQDIANRRYQIAASPQNYALQREFGVMPNLTAAGQSSLDRVWNSYMQDKQFDYNRQLAQQAGDSYSPSFLQGAFAGGLQGAAAGAPFGGWGTGIGAGLGFLGGGFSARR